MKSTTYNWLIDLAVCYFVTVIVGIPLAMLTGELMISGLIAWGLGILLMLRGQRRRAIRQWRLAPRAPLSRIKQHS